MSASRNYYGFLFLFTVLLVDTTLGQECARGVDACVNTAFGIISVNANNKEIICKTTDEFLACIVEETKTCDFVVAASIKEGVSPMIDMYTAPPYSCTLENGDDAAVRADPCSEKLNRCAVFYTQADTETNPGQACSMFERYLECMKIDTSLCNDQLASDILDHSLNATVRFDNTPYFCEERLMYDIDGVDREMSQCYEILSEMDIGILKQDYICGVYEDFYNCTTTTLANASPRQFTLYAANVDRDVASFRTMPFFCDAEDPCMTLFQSCNASAFSPVIKPCELMDVYSSCLTRSLSSCSQESYIRLAKTVLSLKGDIRNEHNCIESNKGTPAPSDESDINNNNQGNRSNNNNSNTSETDNSSNSHRSEAGSGSSVAKENNPSQSASGKRGANALSSGHLALSLAFVLTAISSSSLSSK